MKLATAGRLLWSRTIGSTIVGEAVDSAVFYPLAFLGVWETDLVVRVMVSNYLLKVLWEVVDDSLHLPHRELPQARRERGLLRPQHRLHAVLAAPERRTSSLVGQSKSVGRDGSARWAQASSTWPGVVRSRSSAGRASRAKKPTASISWLVTGSPPSSWQPISTLYV